MFNNIVNLVFKGANRTVKKINSYKILVTYGIYSIDWVEGNNRV